MNVRTISLFLYIEYYCNFYNFYFFYNLNDDCFFIKFTYHLFNVSMKVKLQ